MSATSTAAGPDLAAERWVEAFTEGWRSPASLDAFVDHFEPWFTDDVRMVQPQLPTMVGREAFREGFRPAFELIDGLRATVHRWAAAGDVVFVEFTLEGTIGRRAVRVPAVDRFTLRDGLVAERVTHFDPTPMVLAIGASPRAWPRFARLQLSQLRSPLERNHQ